jgi:hypothetical protein
MTCGELTRLALDRLVPNFFLVLGGLDPAAALAPKGAVVELVVEDDCAEP